MRGTGWTSFGHRSPLSHYWTCRRTFGMSRRRAIWSAWLAYRPSSPGREGDR